MSEHLDPKSLQDLLDGELEPAVRRAAEVHLATCARCASERATYQRVFGSLANLPTWDPGPAFTDRVMAEILPQLSPSADRRPAWVRPFAWGYGVAVMSSVAGLGVALVTPAGRLLAHEVTFAAVRSIVASLLFVSSSFNDVLLRLVEASGWFSTAGSRLSPFARVVLELLQQPVLLSTLLAALVACSALLWWMRPRDGRSWKGMQDVGLLGL